MIPAICMSHQGQTVNHPFDCPLPITPLDLQGSRLFLSLSLSVSISLQCVCKLFFFFNSWVFVLLFLPWCVHLSLSIFVVYYVILYRFVFMCCSVNALFFSVNRIKLCLFRNYIFCCCLWWWFVFFLNVFEFCTTLFCCSMFWLPLCSSCVLLWVLPSPNICLINWNDRGNCQQNSEIN